MSPIKTIAVFIILLFTSSAYAAEKQNIKPDEYFFKVLDASLDAKTTGDYRRVIECLSELKENSKNPDEMMIGLLDYYIGEEGFEILDKYLTDRGKIMIEPLSDKMGQRINCLKKYKPICVGNIRNRNDSIIQIQYGIYMDLVGVRRTKDNEVVVYDKGVQVPLGRILLIRKGSDCFALKFTRLWSQKNRSERFSAYEVYHQGDGTGDFLKKNVTMTEGKTSRLPLKGPFRPYIYQPGDIFVKCGPYKLILGYKTFVGFMPPDKGLGEYGFELAPTPWTDIKEVNVNDSRVKWYRYDEKREKVFINIDKLWQNEGR